MKITLTKKNQDHKTETTSTCEAEASISKIKSEAKGKYVSELHTILEYAGDNSRGHHEHIDRLSRVCPAPEYGRTREGEQRMKRHSGIVLLEVWNLSGLSEVELMKEQVSLLPQTYATFAGSSGRNVKIWALFALPDRKLPQRGEEIKLFHACAYRTTVRYYQPTLPFLVALKEPSPADTFRMTLDEWPYLNVDTAPFCLEQPLTMPGEQTSRQRHLIEKNPLQRLQPGFGASQTFTLLLEAALNRALDETEDRQRDRDDLHPLLIRVGEQCFKANIPEEEVVRQVMIHCYHRADERTVRVTLHSLYQGCKGFGERKLLTPEQLTTLELDEFMERRYEFRYNQLMSDLECCQRDSIHFYFSIMNQRARDSMAMDALLEELRVWDRGMNHYLTSNHVPPYNLVEGYLYGTGHWDGKSRTRAFADLVPCNNQYQRELFYR